MIMITYINRSQERYSTVRSLTTYINRSQERYSTVRSLVIMLDKDTTSSRETNSKMKMAAGGSV